MGDWKKYSFKEIASLSKGKYNPKKEKLDLPCIELEHLESETGRLLGYTSSLLQRSTKNRFNPGDILYGKLRPYLRKYYFPNFEGVCSSEIWVLKNEKQKVYNKYLYYVIQTNRFNQNANKSSGTKMPRADWDFVSETVFPIPPFNEQYKIALILSTWDKAIELKEKLIEQKKERKKGLMQKLLTGKLRVQDFKEAWKYVPIEKVCNLSIGKTPSRRNDDYWGEGYKWIAISDMKGKYISKTQEEITEKAVQETGIKIIPKYTVIMSFKLTLGRLGITAESMYSNEAIVSFTNKNYNELDDEFLYYYLSSIDITKYGSRAAKGITLNKDSLKEIMVKLPGIDEQIKIREILSTSDREIYLLQKELSFLKQQKKGLMQLLLTGKVRVKV